MVPVVARDPLRYEILDGGVVRLTIDRPDALNSLNSDVLQALVNSLDKAGRDPGLRCVVIAGAGEKAFVAGADVRQMADLGPRGVAEFIELGHRAMRAVETCPVPVVAAVGGYALGGGLELALACDIIVASPGATFALPETGLGLVPGFGGTQRLLRRCGVGVAKRLCLTGDLLSARDAEAAGLVDVTAEDPGGEALRIAAAVSSKAPLATRAAKRAIDRAAEAVLLAGLRHEVAEFLAVFATADREEGVDAFLKKRRPEWRGC